MGTFFRVPRDRRIEIGTFSRVARDRMIEMGAFSRVARDRKSRDGRFLLFFNLFGYRSLTILFFSVVKRKFLFGRF